MDNVLRPRVPDDRCTPVADRRQQCSNCLCVPICAGCRVGCTGEPGLAGPQGPAGGVLNYGDFYALMPGDNAATVAPGTDVSFPQDGPNSGSGIARSGPDSFTLADIGVYQVLFQVSVTEAGQLILTLNGEDLAYNRRGPRNRCFSDRRNGHRGNNRDRLDPDGTQP